MLNRFLQAINGLVINRNGGVVRVADDQTTWLCTVAAWDDAKASLSTQPEIEDEDGGPDGTMLAYGELCRRVAAPVLTVGGSDRGNRGELVALAVLAAGEDLLPEALRHILTVDAAQLAEIKRMVEEKTNRTLITRAAKNQTRTSAVTVYSKKGELRAIYHSAEWESVQGCDRQEVTVRTQDGAINCYSGASAYLVGQASAAETV